MDDGTTLLFDLPGFRAVECHEDAAGNRHVVVMGVADVHACRRCGVLQSKPYDVRESRIKDLPFGQRALTVTWRKRRYRCPERNCPARVFTETSEQIPPRHRLTGRLRGKLEAAASGSARSCSDVAQEYSVSDWSVHKSLLDKAISLIGEPHPVRRLGLDETRTRRRHLPNATIVVDHWHLVRLANAMVTDVRQHAAREQLGRRGRRGRRSDLAWAHRQLLLRAGNTLSRNGLARLGRVLAEDDPTNEISAAWGCKELLRQLLAARDRPTASRQRSSGPPDALGTRSPKRSRRRRQQASSCWLCAAHAGPSVAPQRTPGTSVNAIQTQSGTSRCLGESYSRGPVNR